MSSAPSLAQTDALYPVWSMYGERARRRSRNWAAFGMLGMAALLCGMLSQYHPRAISVDPSLVRQEVMVMETDELPHAPEPVQEIRQEEPAPVVKRKPALVPPPVEKKKKALSPPRPAKSMPQPKKTVPVKSRQAVADAVSSEGTVRIPVQRPTGQAVSLAGDEYAAAGKSAVSKPSGQAVPAAVGNVQLDAERSKVLARILQAVERYKKYPRAGRLAGAEGRLVLTVKIGADGKVVSCGVTSSSGKSVLDAAGEQLGKKLAGLNVEAKTSMTIVVPVHYRLTDD